MYVNIFLTEDAHTSPAYVRTALARHMIAATIFLDPATALWTFPEPKLFVQSFLCCRISLETTLFAGQAFMSFFIACRTDGQKARWTLYCLLVGLAAVDLLAVRSGTVFENLWMVLQVASERNFNQVLECLFRHETPNEWNRDWDIACGVIAHADKWESLGFRGGR
jgi:hypothetical protein